MSTWKQINEIGGAIIARGLCALIASGVLYGFGGAVLREPEKFFTRGKLTTWLLVASALGLFGGYAIFGNRLRIEK